VYVIEWFQCFGEGLDYCVTGYFFCVCHWSISENVDSLDLSII
jgi:hypothetical protein